MVVGHHLGNQVTMVVDDRHLGSMIVVQILSHLGLQNKVLVVELFHDVIARFSFISNYLSAKVSILIRSSKNADIYFLKTYVNDLGHDGGSVALFRLCRKHSAER
jgi:hypothetical protein